ncbi:cyclophilin-like fold protein [Emticicia agri]|uniref:Cyclophilin-like domain-containing protein n=1 Tax=Emticicia agri TaxID=2492393 RepID=A0A4Q5LV62_9BACT|nr:cyclophilin-like fold protein [Emticicia agri]RYU93611.1 hypothetical protein EWM59_20985 [Emticicia agri]
MNRSLPLAILLAFFIGMIACKPDNSLTPENTHSEKLLNMDSTAINKNRLKIKIGSSTFTATLLDNPTVTTFKAKLPLTIEMSDFNDNEKLYRFSGNLPTNNINPEKINTGDLMLYSGNTLVLFYKSFPTIYSYTRLGKIDDTNGLATALGSGNIKVTFTLE